MASIRKYRNGWRAEIARDGLRKSKTFATKREAQDWANREEYLIRNAPAADRSMFGEVMERYAREVSPKNRGARWEMIRLEKLRKDQIAQIAIGDLSAEDLGGWRDRRLREVAPGSVRREMGLLSAVLTQSRKEWGLIERNPMEDVRKPASPPPRDRLPSSDEMAALALSAGEDMSKSTARAFAAFRFSIETAMRAGEIIGLSPDTVDREKRVAHLPRTKNGTAREVPLSSAAIEILDSLPDADPLFGLNSAQLDALWRKLRDRAAVEDLKFHDARHAAITQLAQKLEVLDLARMVGHRDLKMLLTYYNERAEDLAKKLG